MDFMPVSTHIIGEKVQIITIHTMVPDHPLEALSATLDPIQAVSHLGIIPDFHLIAEKEEKVLLPPEVTTIPEHLKNSDLLTVNLQERIQKDVRLIQMQRGLHNNPEKENHFSAGTTVIIREHLIITEADHSLIGVILLPPEEAQARLHGLRAHPTTTADRALHLALPARDRAHLHALQVQDLAHQVDQVHPVDLQEVVPEEEEGNVHFAFRNFNCAGSV